jgi:hypothetical protein
MNKRELLDELESSRERFLELLDDLADDAFEEPGVIGVWSLKDVLAHLTRWEAELVKLLWQISQGQVPTSAQFSQISVDTMNEKWYREMRSRSLDLVLQDFHSVRNQTMRRVEEFLDKDLMDPNRYRWLEGKPLWKWVAADSFEHEDEHALQVKTWKELKNTPNPPPTA